MENKDKIKKTDIFYVAVLIISLLIMVAGATMAYFSATVTQKDEATQIYSGTLVIDFVDGRTIQNPHLVPRMAPTSVDDIEGVSVHTFGVESKGTLDQYINATFDVITNEFSNNNLKFAVYNNSTKQLVKTGSITSGKVPIIDKTFLKSKDTAYYTLLIWLEESGSNQDSEQGKHFSGRLTVNATDEGVYK